MGGEPEEASTDLQFVDQDIWDPDGFGGDGHLGDVVKVLWIPFQEFVDPVLQNGWEMAADIVFTSQVDAEPFKQH